MQGDLHVRFFGGYNLITKKNLPNNLVQKKENLIEMQGVVTQCLCATRF